MSIFNYFKEFNKSLDLSDKFIEWIRKNRWGLMLTIVIISAWGLVLVLNVRNVDTILVEIRELEKESRDIENLNERYLYEIVNLQSAERIIKIAEEQLNMEQSQKAPDILK